MPVRQFVSLDVANRQSDVGNRGRPAEGGEQRVGHGDDVEGVAPGAGRRPRAPPPPAAQPHGQPHPRYRLMHIPSQA